MTPSIRDLIRLVEQAPPDGMPVLAPGLLDDFDLSSFDGFMASLKRAPKEQVVRLQAVFDAVRETSVRPHAGYLELYHGTPSRVADTIQRDGFALTKGRRGGFMGSVHEVDNHGIFLTDAKPLARYFGANRAESPQDHRLLTCYVDGSHILDTAKPPREVVRLGLKLVNAYNGTSLSRLPIREWWWLLDRREFVDLLLRLGYTGVRFQESTAVRRAAQAMNGHTYLIFDPASIIIGGRDGITGIRAFYDWLVRRAETAPAS